MNNYIFLLIILWLFIRLEQRRKCKIAVVVNHRLNNKKGTVKMKTFAERFIGKECIIYTFSNIDAIKGVIKEVSDNGMLVDCKGNLRAINLEYITEIREYPKNSKGSKKKIVF